MTLRTRVLLAMAVVAAVLALSALAIARATRDHLTDQIDRQLAAAAPRLPWGPSGYGAEPPEGEEDGGPPRLSELYVGLLGDDGALTPLAAPDLRTDDAPLPRVSADQVGELRAGHTVTVASEGSYRYRMVAHRDGERGLVVLALSLADVDAAVRRLVWLEGSAVAVVIAVLALVTWWVVRLGVRPLRRMTDAASAIAGGDLSLRVPESRAGTEAGDLSVALNQMLGQIETAFDERTESEVRLRQFVDDASHELRTPITTIRGYAELYRHGALADDDALGEAMRRTEQEAQRMGALVDDLLHLARLDRGRPPAQEPVDLAALVGDAVSDARAVHPGRTVTVDAPAELVVVGDEPRLRQVLANVVGNALVHAPDSPVEVRLRTEGAEAVLEVEDRGPGMAAVDAERAFERFYRADASRSRHRGGSGLGLSIVEATARAHGGAATLVSEPGRGTTITVTLPRVP